MSNRGFFIFFVFVFIAICGCENSEPGKVLTDSQEGEMEKCFSGGGNSFEVGYSGKSSHRVCVFVKSK